MTGVAVLAAAALVLLVPGVIFVAWIVEACIGDEASYDVAVREVQRFVALTERSRAELHASPRLPLWDSDGGCVTSDAIARALELKHAARRELWPVREQA